MPICPQCDNRPFTNKEALLQHMKSSSAWHPFCSICDRRFSSQMAYDAHMADKHPPTFDCLICNRNYHAIFALEDHYRGSTAHPNCVRCGRGFKDPAACDEHQRTDHPKAQCAQCGGVWIYEDALDQHYRDSPNHPSCHLCNLGFKDRQLYLGHFSCSHPELHCALCMYNFETSEALQSHFLASSLHPKCERCNMGFPDSERYNSHLNATHTSSAYTSVDADPDNQAPIADRILETMDVPVLSQTPMTDTDLHSTGFSPLSPRNPVQALIVGEKRTSSPDLRLELMYSSPLTEVKPLFSPATPNSLPRPADIIEQFWTSRENITTPRLPLTPTEPSIFTNVAPLHAQSRYNDPGRNLISAPIWSDSTQPTFRPREGRSNSSLPMASPPRTTPVLLPSPPQSAHRADFDSRLYPGSVRQAMRLQNDSLGRRRSLGTGSRNGATSSQSSLVRYRGSGGRSDELNWSQLIREEDEHQSISSYNRASLFSETLTPRVEAAEDSSQDSHDYLRIHVHNPTTSPSFATTSSPTSSALGNSPGSHNPEPDTRPTTASSTPSIHAITYTVTPGSQCPSPHSPEVISPIGLGVLPIISPLAATPIELHDFDIPEARKPLPESPAGSPMTLVLDIKPGSQTMSSTLPSPHTNQNIFRSPLSTASEKSYITSPQDPLDAGSNAPSTAVTSPVTPVALAASTSTASNLNPLHCRACLADTCDDITASMCGHIFCNRCITDAVIKTNRCPVCMTPTLLYCLFRLDLAA